MLVVDVHTLGAVHLLDLADQVVLHRLPTAYVEQLLGAHRPGGDGVARPDLVPVADSELGAVGDRVLLDILLKGPDPDLPTGGLHLRKGDLATDPRLERDLLAALGASGQDLSFADQRPFGDGRVQLHPLVN